METTVRGPLVEFFPTLKLPTCAYLDWGAVEEGSGKFRLYLDASIDGFGKTLEQEQPNGLARPVTYTSRATLDSQGLRQALD